MGFLEMAAIGVMGAFVNKMISNAQETAEEEKRKRKQEEKRKNTPCNFEDGISEEQFEIIVKRACRHIKRLTDFKINGPVVYGKVRAISGISEWSFQVDFNDYGHITGEYWLSSGNDDSSIPKKIAEDIKNMIRSYSEEFEQSKTTSKFDRHDDSNIHDDISFSGESLDSTGSETIRQRSEQSLNGKERIKKKIKIFSWLLLLGILLSIIIFAYYKYKESQKYIEVGISSSEAVGQDYRQIMEELEQTGFTNIYVNPEYDLKIEDIENEDKVSRIEVQGDKEFDNLAQYPYDVPIEIFYHALKNIDVPISAKASKKMTFTELEIMLKEAGFVNVSTQAKYDLITGWITKDGIVDELSINGETEFSEGTSYRPDAEIIIIYHTFKKNKD